MQGEARNGLENCPGTWQWQLPEPGRVIIWTSVVTQERGGQLRRPEGRGSSFLCHYIIVTVCCTGQDVPVGRDELSRTLSLAVQLFYNFRKALIYLCNNFS